MKIIQSGAFLVAASTLALAGLGFAGAAQAGNEVYWNVGVGSPGVQLGVSNAPPVYYQPAPVYRPPVYVQPYPVYVAPPQVVYVRPAPIYVAPTYYAPTQYVQTGWERPGRGWGHGHRHHKKDRYESGRYDGGHNEHDREDRD